MADLEIFQHRRDRLEKWLAGVLPGATSVALTPFRAASSGFSNVTLLTTMTVQGAGGPKRRDLVLRAQSSGSALFPDYDLRFQYDVMAALQKTDVPVPEVLWFIDDPDVMGGPCYLMEQVRGLVASGFRPGFHGHGLFYDATVERRQTMWFNAIDAMAAIHRLPLRGLALPDPLDQHLTGGEAINRTVDDIESQLARAGIALPLLELAVDHLRNRIPTAPTMAVCWGDARPGNIVYRDDQVVAVLDWELAHLGQPEGDLAYFLLVDEVVAELNDVPRLDGLPDAAATIAHYEDRLGRSVSDFAFQTVLQALRMAAMLALTVTLSPPQLQLRPDYLTENVAMRRISELIN
ncbi:phosphotransferase family protein [Mycolicibacterium boenickei]|nr:phosphotransferase family protein [Mycolicibacterium boenickei]